MIEYIAKISEDLQQIKKDMADLEKLEAQYESLDNKEEKLEQLKLINSQMEKMVNNMSNSEKAEFQRKLKRMEREVDRQSGQEDIYYQLVVEEYATVVFLSTKMHISIIAHFLISENIYLDKSPRKLLWNRFNML